jgi:Phytanoyl-CoA dioxygenase (PhyH)
MNLALPSATNDPQRAIEDLRRAGVCRVTGLLSDAEVDELRRAVQEATELDLAKNRLDRYSDGANYRLWSLFNRGECFLRLAEHPVALSIIGSIVGEHPLVSNLSANVTGPGGVAMVPHWDQDWAERPWPHALVAHVLWMVDDFTAENGATVVAPGSHRIESPPPVGSMVSATGSAGTALVIDGRTWHGTGINSTTDDKRAGILAYYCRPYVRQQENMTLSIAEHVHASMTAERRALFGLDFWEYLNMVDGPPRHLPRY